MHTSTWRSDSPAGNQRAVRAPSRRPLPIPVVLTAAMVLAAAGLGLAGPVGAAVLIYRQGAARGTAVTASLALAVLAVAVTLGSAAVLFARAWQRTHRVVVRPAPVPERVRPAPGRDTRVRVVGLHGDHRVGTPA